MKNIFIILIVFISSTASFSQSIVDYVQPLSGTAPSTTVSAKKHSEAGTKESNANTIPAVGVPFGMTQWTPQTRTTEIKCQPPYYYVDSLLSGFRATHWISGSCTQDYGSFTIVPVVGKLRTTVKEYSIPFSHKNETASPHYYKIDLPAAKLTVEMTATARCGLMRFVMQADDSLYLLIIPNSDEGQGFAKVDARKQEVVASNPAHRIYQGWGQPAGFSGHAFIQVGKQIATHGVFADGNVFNGDSISNRKNIGAYVGFAMKKGESIDIRIGTSFTSIIEAHRNLVAEASAQDFYGVATVTEKHWDKALSQIQIETPNEKDKRIFYTAMYHAFQHPRLFNDVDGSYPRFAGSYKIEKKTSGNYYDDFSMWDTYRAQLPLLEILQPKLVNEFVQSMIIKGKQGDWLPIFPCWNNYTAAMIGDHVTAFIASAYNKGLRNYNVAEAYRLMRQNAFDVANDTDYKNGKGRRALPSYLKYGYIPIEDSVPEAFHKKEQVSRTLEYAFDDYALSLVAKGLNKMSDYKILQQRSFNYKNIFDKGVGMMRSRHADGSFTESFHPDIRESYITEGTPRQYSFYVPHDVPGLAKLMGGTKAFENALDSLFIKNEYWHGNEPGHQIPFLYNYTASPWKTQQQVRKILSEEYDDGAGGLSGNDDAGQMSAWYVFAAMGFYPVNPVSGEYQICSPLFDKTTLQLPGGKRLQVVCRRKSSAAIYIASIKWNGKPYTKNFIRHADLMGGGRLEIDLVEKL